MRNYPVSVLDLSMISQGQTSADALADTIEVARAADRLGLERIWLAEHHNMASVAATTPPVLAAAVAARTERIRVGSGGVMLPNHSPYVVAEQFALLEALHPGRIDLGLGRAPGADQVTAWALRRTQEGLGAEEYAEHVQLVSAWLSPRGVQVGRGMELVATPHATSYPEIWLLGSSDYSARLAGRLGVRYAYAGHFGSLDPAAILGLYRASFTPGETLSEPHSMLCTSAIVGSSEDEAILLASPARLQFANMHRNVREPIQPPDVAAARLGELGNPDFGGAKIVGTADQVRADLDELVAQCEADELMVATTAYALQTRIDTLAAIVD